LTVLAGLLLLALAGCGVPLDEAPQPVTRPTIAAGRGTPTTIASTEGPEVGVYFLRDDRLVRVGYPVAQPASLADALGFALGDPPDGSTSLRTAIPPGTSLLAVDVDDDGVARIDLSNEVNDVQGQAQKEAFAQLVFTALGADDLTGVRFAIDGEAVDAPTDDGNLSVVTAANYDPPLNPR
jgi:spore germination protein GerM